ncbi:CoA transferase [Reyranella sp.]|uniref:CoA transferase n=1 Tax=Reyranella sp. TaxID=1929291 RepID=UPI003D0A9A07
MLKCFTSVSKQDAACSISARSTHFFSANSFVLGSATSLDLNKPEGKRILEDLIRSADNVLEGYLPGTMDRMGLGDDYLRALCDRRPLQAGHDGPRLSIDASQAEVGSARASSVDDKYLASLQEKTHEAVSRWRPCHRRK